MESTTPTTDVTWDQCPKPKPVKARIQRAIDFLKSEGITGKNEAVFRANGVSVTRECDDAAVVAHVCVNHSMCMYIYSSLTQSIETKHPPT